MAMIRSTPQFKIVDVRTVLLTGPCTQDPHLIGCRLLRSAAFIEIDAQGVSTSSAVTTGTGETYAGYFVPEIVPSVIDFHKPILMGMDLSELSVGEIMGELKKCRCPSLPWL